MKLTSFSNYCVRLLMIAAVRSPTLTTIRESSARFGISEAHLVKCVHHLGAWGYLDTVRGNRGGFRLAVAPEAIVLGAVIRKTEDGFKLVECFDPATNTCPLIHACHFRKALQAANAAFLAVLDSVTLADLAANKAELQAIFALDAVQPVPVPAVPVLETGCPLRPASP
ncbi:RrF2 family transcriptional regulator [Insolitispirillum peregrinum]|uniref:Transcriptional regulator, BadM/Rrf2 family n=1 Tax=Insolitispirillum peregrinum TaxID=80876 RepID=A0A1N7LAS3_9PROT|nr:Rrf2 family transcriptional regulator [Insolitispirillum peregrinum]SIS70938.1 transcriptional regulator, BadM/Rrf2 family [Insolitispirillum peregrinum]